MDDARRFAIEQFGHAELGDSRRTDRLVAVTAEVLKHPSPIVSRSCGTSASREGAFRLLENGKFPADALRKALYAKTQKDCRGEGTVIVPVDASSIRVSDKRSKGLGMLARRDKGARGFHAMTALAVADDGTPIGICSQKLWVRTRRSTENQKGRASGKSEGRFWLEALEAVEDLFEGTDARPWVQMDRGADCWRVLALAGGFKGLVTVRATHDRRLETDAHLWATLQRAEIRAKARVDVPARPPRKRTRRVGGKIVNYLTRPRKTRVAKLVIRAAQVALTCSAADGGVVPINAVFVSESGGPRNDRIEWMLFTTHPIRTRTDVLEIVRGYTLRWRIEDFHRAWKRGLCGVEDTKLRSRDAVFKWSTILAAVAIRAMRLTHLARQTPDVLASTEFSPYELRAIIVQRKPKGFDMSCIPTMTLQQAIRWIADTAGYNGPWKGPPGATIVGRGLHEIELIAEALENHDKMR